MSAKFCVLGLFGPSDGKGFLGTRRYRVNLFDHFGRSRFEHGPVAQLMQSLYPKMFFTSTLHRHACADLGVSDPLHHKVLETHSPVKRLC